MLSLRSRAILALLLFLAFSAAFIRGPQHQVFTAAPSRLHSSISLAPGALQASSSGNHSRFISFRNEKFKIHYEEYRCSTNPAAPSILLVPGFGVGTFHYSRQLEALSDAFNVYSLDLLGQGQSWPEGPVLPEDALCFSVDLWRDQLEDFVCKVIQGPVHLVGNSLGGYLSASVASHRPDLVKSVTLLNAAPFWGFAAPSSSEPKCWPLSALALWNGTLPAPPGLLKFGSAYFDVMRRPSTIKTMLAGVYASACAFDDGLVNDIVASASGPGGYDAFTSILFAPKSNRSFDSMLADIRRAAKPVALVYGRDDPWIVPYWGQRAKRALDGMGTYFELRGAGHCPHHEAPSAVNSILRAWVGVVEGAAAGAASPPSLLSLDPRLRGLEGEYPEAFTGAAVRVELVEGKPRSLWERFLYLLDGMRGGEEDD